MHIIFVILAVIASTLSTKAQTVIAHIMSVIISLLLLAKMIYQIDNIKHDNWNVTCENVSIFPPSIVINYFCNVLSQ